jgi:AraC-like DNA-binding protein/TolB-like protein
MNGIERAKLIERDNQRLWPQHVKRALAYMRANMAERITLTGLASACGVPERTLLRQFQQFVGLAPLAYLRRLRLSAAKSELASTQNSDAVSDIAMRCGFSHLGRFAIEYRRLFGETPSTTRQRVRALAADSALANNDVSCFGDSRPSPLPAVQREKPSLLILPLRTETLQESLKARDLTERLAATLSRIRVASVVLVNPSHAHSPNGLPLQPRNAGAEYALCGRLSQQGERLRVTVRLVDLATQQHLWGDSFDGSITDLFALQDRVVDGALCGVASRLVEAEIERVSAKDPTILDARDLTLQALPLILSTNLPSTRRAIATLDHALEMDPANPLPMALLAYCHAQLVGYLDLPALPAACETARSYYRRAGALDNNDPLVTVARASTASILLEWNEADVLATRALAMDPSSAWAWERRGFTRVFSSGGLDYAIDDFRRALRLRGPTMPQSNCFLGIADAHRAAGHWEEAILWTRKAIAANPQAIWLHRNRSYYAWGLGDRTELRQAVDCLRRGIPELTASRLARFCPSPDWADALVAAGLPP